MFPLTRFIFTVLFFSHQTTAKKTMSNVAVIAAVLIIASLTLQVSAQMDMSPSSGPSGAPDCMTNLMNMTGCLSYVMIGEGGGATKPDKTCCPALAGLVESSPQCLCYLLSGDMAAQLGIQIDKSKALKLPGVCGVVTPDPSLCSRIYLDLYSSFCF